MRLMRMALEADASTKEQEQQAAAPTDETKEASEAKGPMIVMKGPLADIYRKALDVVLAKKDSVTGDATVGQEEGIATESQANDALMMAHLARAADPGDEDSQHLPDPAVMTVYGVSAADINDQVVVDITSHLAKKSPERDFVLLIDATQPGPNSQHEGVPVERFEMLSSALEEMVRAHGGHTAKSLSELREHMLQTHTGATTLSREIGKAALQVLAAPAAALLGTVSG